MSDVLTYTLSLQDQISAKLQKIGISSDTALDKFSKLQTQSVKTSQLLKDMGGSVGALRDKLNLLKAEKEWIPVSNLTSIRKYNTEIKKLEKEITRLDTINGSAFKTNLKDAISNLPMAGLITNPVVAAGAALFSAGKMAVSFEEGMAKINTTAQLAPKELKSLQQELIGMGTSVGADLSTVPEAFEKILSQTNDVKLSTDILQQSLKGSKAGFADQTVVADALSRTLSLVGKENTNAKEVLDTLFAAKRVGAGEFKDFANYVPGLVASGQALGLGFKEAAGLFSFMTAKGQSAERSTMLLENAFTALGKSEITGGLQKEGISVFNTDGSMKQMDVIFGQLQQKLQGFGNDDKAKSSFLEKIGLKDAQAKQAFMVLASDSKKLAESLREVANSEGETDKAFKNSANPMQNIAMLWSKTQQLAISFGGIVSTILVPALSGILIVVTPVFDVLTWVFDKIKDGNPLVLILAGAIGALTIAYNYNKIAAMAVTLWNWRLTVLTKLSSFWIGIQIAAINFWTGAQWLLNIALNANPIGLIILGVAALIALVYVVVKYYDDWGASLTLLMGPFGMLINVIMSFKRNWDSVVSAFKDGGILAGIKRIGIVLLDAILYPVQQLLNLLSKIPGLGKLAGSGADKIQEIRNSLGLANPEVAATTEMKYPFAKAATPAAGSNPFAPALSGYEKFQPGIAPAAIPGATPGGAPTKDDTKKNLKPTTDAIASGGSRSSNTTITFKNLIENIVFDGNLADKRADLEREVSSAVMRILAMAQASG